MSSAFYLTLNRVLSSYLQSRILQVWKWPAVPIRLTFKTFIPHTVKSQETKNKP